MTARLADQLRMARQHHFVGRTAEQAVFQAVLTAATLPFNVLFLHGMGGVGKTTLLRQWAAMCQQARIPAVVVDARTMEPTPAAFMSALHHALNLTPSESPIAALANRTSHQVLLIDSYEVLAPLDGWMRETFLPQLPAATLVVLAGREPPPLAWTADPGWASMIRLVPLGNLSPHDSRAYLSRRQVPAEHHQVALDFTHGHPLALSLVADVISQQPHMHFQPEAVPDVLTALLHQFREHVPSAAHRMALEACAVVRTLTEPLLAEMTNLPDVHMLFEWLRALSFIDAGPFGLFLHELAREVLAADLRWRDHDCYARYVRHAAAFYTSRLQQGKGWEQERLLFDLLFLHRDSSVMRPLFESFEWQERSRVYMDVARESDVPAMVAMVARHEGEESARLAARWLSRQLHRAVVFRETSAESSTGLAGFVLWLALHEASDDDLRSDPATQLAWQHVQRHAPLRPGDGAAYRRFEMARDTYQAVSPIQSLNVVDWERHLLVMPWLGPVFKAYAHPDFWTPLLAYAEIARVPQADFEVGQRTYAAYAIDTRVLPPIARWTLLNEKLLDASGHTPLQPPPARLRGRLSEPEFAMAVRDAFRSFAYPDRLHGNVLLQSRLVRARAGVGAGEAERIAACQSLVQQAAEALQSTPRHVKWYRALYHTYFHPAPTQEQAAELLNLPFSTYRRHLQAGIRCVAEKLWHWEVDATEK